MRVAKMPHIYTEKRKDKATGRETHREVYYRRFPKDVQTHTGDKFVHKWPLGVSRQQANDDTTVPEKFNKLITDARRALAPAPPAWTRVRQAGSLPEHVAYEHVPAGSLDEIEPGDRLYDHKGYTVDNPKAAGALTGKPVLPADVITIWKTERNAENRPPSDDAITNKVRKMERLFAWLENNRPGFPMGCRDMRRVGADDMAAYRVALLADGVARDHLIDIKSLFNTARKAILVRPDPTEDIDIPAKATNTRLPFPVPDQRRILEAARDPAFVAKIVSPAALSRGLGAALTVRWIHWAAAFTGAIMSELIKVKIDSIKYDDEFGVWTIFIPGSKTLFRPRGLIIHASLIREGFLSYVETVRQRYGDDAPLFPDWNADQAGAAANKLIRELGIKNPLLVHYSWRHVVCTRLDKVPEKISLNLANYVTGHAPVGIKGKHYIHPELDDVKQAINVLIDPTQPVELDGDAVKRAA